MANNRNVKNLVNKGHRRPFNIFKCKLERCNNFITSLERQQIWYCRSHYDKNHKIMKALTYFRSEVLIKSFSKTGE